MTDQSNDVTSSYQRCRSGDERFFDTFYERFLTKSPNIARKFARTNFRIQKLMLRESLLEMLCLHRGMSGAREEILRLARRHHDLNITPEMYEAWLDALCEAVRMHDPKYTPELEASWRTVMRPGIDLMTMRDVDIERTEDSPTN